MITIRGRRRLYTRPAMFLNYVKAPSESLRLAILNNSLSRLPLLSNSPLTTTTFLCYKKRLRVDYYFLALLLAFPLALPFELSFLFSLVILNRPSAF